MPNIDYFAEIGPTRARSLVEAKRRSEKSALLSGTFLNSSTGKLSPCWLFLGSKNTDGYGQLWTKPNLQLKITGRSAQKAFLIHRLSFMARTKSAIPEGIHISHLCNNRSCFNPDHLHGETSEANNSRKGCIGDVFATCPNCECGHEFLVRECPHRPKCIPEHQRGAFSSVIS